jgi:hypothetical protein
MEPQVQPMFHWQVVVFSEGLAGDHWWRWRTDALPMRLLVIPAVILSGLVLTACATQQGRASSSEIFTCLFQLHLTLGFLG